MALAPGTKLGHFEIAGPIGAGGMGEVYKAKDTRLDRTVAIKVLPEHLSKDPERRERFEREARAVSSLNHPNICTLYDVGHHDEIDFMVMEYIEGETLTDRLERGALPLEQALQFGIQMADALDKAHRQGVVHRDFKPGNVMLTKPGIKLLDFGLAKFRQDVSPESADSEQPTQQKPLTDAGAILGTVQYMAPEQLEGKEADARSDIFAFGAVLYEMVTGQRAFEGKSQASLITAIMSSEPSPLSELEPMSPAALDRIVKKCLAKDPEDRWHAAHDLMDEVRWVAEGGESVATSPARQKKTVSLVLAALVLVGVVAGFAAWKLKPEGARPVSRWVMTLPPSEPLINNYPAVALSPDGARLAYATGRQLYLRSMDRLAAAAIPSSERAHSPFFSPDGEWLGFFTANELKKVSVHGGEPQSLANVVRGSKATWGSDGNIIFSDYNATGLSQVSASGGTVDVLTQLNEGEWNHEWPEILPGGEAVLFSTKHSESGTSDIQIVVQSLATGERKVLLEESSYAHYASTGYLVYIQAGRLMAVAFDLDRLEVMGDPVPVVDDSVMESGTGFGQFSLSGQGTLVYVASEAQAGRRMVWIDRQGRATPAAENEGQFGDLRLSPDGTRIAVAVHPAAASHDIWIYNVERGSRIRLTTESHNNTPVWTPDGKRVTFASPRAGSENLYWKPADGSG